MRHHTYTAGERCLARIHSPVYRPICSTLKRDDICTPPKAVFASFHSATNMRCICIAWCVVRGVCLSVCLSAALVYSAGMAEPIIKLPTMDCNFLTSQMNIYNYLGDPLSGDTKWKVCGIEATAHNDVIILHALYKAAKGLEKTNKNL